MNGAVSNAPAQKTGSMTPKILIGAWLAPEVGFVVSA